MSKKYNGRGSKAVSLTEKIGDTSQPETSGIEDHKLAHLLFTKVQIIFDNNKYLSIFY